VSRMGPEIFLTTFLSKTAICSSSFFVNTQHSAPYVTTGLISVL
jgi:hypothetical protein